MRAATLPIPQSLICSHNYVAIDSQNYTTLLENPLCCPLKWAVHCHS